MTQYSTPMTRYLKNPGSHDMLLMSWQGKLPLIANHVKGRMPACVIPVEIRDLEFLAASARIGNFARAAESFGMSTSTISRRIGRLEDELGLALFERGHSGVRLTAGG